MTEKENKNKLEDLFRTKLQHFEADPMPDDWDAICRRLPVRTTVSFKKAWRYVAAAAVVSLLVVVGSIYLFNGQPEEKILAEKINSQLERQQDTLQSIPQIAAPPVLLAKDSVLIAEASSPAHKKNKLAVVLPAACPTSLSSENKETTFSVSSADEENKIQPQSASATRSASADQSFPQESALKNKTTTKTLSTTQKRRLHGWRFGASAGNLGGGNNSTVGGVLMPYSVLANNQLKLMSSATSYKNDSKTDIRHKVPLSFGVSASKQLNGRFSLQTGLVYTLLSSKWKTNTIYEVESKQKLHYLGIPVSIVYKIAEWDKLVFYASAGGMVELNVAGKLSNKLVANGEKIGEEQSHIRMKEPFWSVNVRAGVSYPLIRFVNLFAEAGANYYFDNGSDIATIRSDKPFNPSFQIGFRFGF